MRNKSKYPLVKVLWVDIVSDSHWKPITDFEKEKLPVCVTVGYLFKKTKKLVWIFSDFSVGNRDIDEVGNTTILPLSVVIKIEFLT